MRVEGMPELNFRTPHSENPVVNYRERLVNEVGIKLKAGWKWQSFLDKVSLLAKTSHQSHLKDIEVKKLTPEDMLLFQKFEKGKLTLAEIEAQLIFLRGEKVPTVITGKEIIELPKYKRSGYMIVRTTNSRKLLNYMRMEILKKKLEILKKQQARKHQEKQTDLDFAA